ncbi:type VI secretion system lipoprotein TssJ [Litoribrevibacter euphylliae]|uniref:Type VI secretion system lipoprotein TssJ n=1 Tax=Litoribrevibacter euphylliae TaxID=1834034 RepID=A0ABV7HFP8_9GAMM
MNRLLNLLITKSAVKSVFQMAMFAVVVALSGCSSNDPIPLIVSHKVIISVGDEVNPYGGNKSHPIVLRVYQLSESGTFQKSGFIDLYRKDIEVLGGSLVDVHNVPPLVPGEQYTLALDIHRQSQYLAVFAEFANYDNAKSKAVIKLPQDSEAQLVIRVSGLSVSITEATDD